MKQDAEFSKIVLHAATIPFPAEDPKAFGKQELDSNIPVIQLLLPVFKRRYFKNREINIIAEFVQWNQEEKQNWIMAPHIPKLGLFEVEKENYSF